MFFKIIKLAGVKFKSILLIILLLISTNLLTLFSSRLIGNITDTAQNGSLEAVLSLIPILMVVLFVQLIIGTLKTYYFKWKQQRSSNQLSIHAADRILNARSHKLSEQNSGDLYTRATNNLRQSTNYIFGSSLNLLSVLINFCVCSCYLISMRWYLFPAFLLMWGGIFLAQYWLSHVPGGMMDRTAELEARVFDNFQKNYKFLTVIRAYGLERRQEEKLSQNMGEYLDASKKTWKHRSLLIVPMTLLTYCPTFIMFVLLSYISSRQIITVGEIAAAATLLISANSQLESLPTILMDWRSDKAGVKRFLQLLDIETEPGEPTLPDTAANNDEAPITLSHVSFAYKDTLVLNDVSLTIKDGEHVAIVGLSGSGKSTLLRLMMGLHRPTQGTVRIFGADPYDDLRVRDNISAVPQQSTLFEGTVRQNIAYGNSSASDKQIDLAMQDACVDFDADGNTSGDTLSGGQRRRVELARSYLKDASLFFFDETLSEIDSANQNKILRNQGARLRGKTRVTVTHCPMEALNAQRVLVMSHGRIAEEGSPAELLKNGGLFQQMFSGTEATDK